MSLPELSVSLTMSRLQRVTRRLCTKKTKRHRPFTSKCLPKIHRHLSASPIMDPALTIAHKGGLTIPHPQPRMKMGRTWHNFMLVETITTISSCLGLEFFLLQHPFQLRRLQVESNWLLKERSSAIELCHMLRRTFNPKKMLRGKSGSYNCNTTYKPNGEWIDGGWLQNPRNRSVTDREWRQEVSTSSTLHECVDVSLPSSFGASRGQRCWDRSCAGLCNVWTTGE